MLSELLLAVGAGLLAYSFFKWVTKKGNDYFSKRNLPFRKPAHALDGFVNRETGAEFSQTLYNSFPEEKLYGIFQFGKPMLVVRDPELLKKLTVKDFDHFEDRRPFIDPESDDMFGGSLFMMQGQRWRNMRSTLSPAFTGRKVREMFELVTECADDMTKYFLKEAAAGKSLDFEMKNLISRYTSDVIATCAFGIRINSFENPDNEFFVSGKTFVDFSGASLLRFFFLSLFPWLAKKLNIQFIPSSIGKFFTKVVIDTMKERKLRGIIRPDMINILMQVRQGKLIDGLETEQKEHGQDDRAEFASVEESDIGKKVSQHKWTDKDLIAQAFLFFIAGYDSTSIILMFLAYELSINPDIQQKLYEEISETNENLGGKRINYDTLLKMKYLDQVVSESLRKWPSSPQVDRLCVKDYLCEYDDNAKFLIEKGVSFFIPIYGFHHDPNYYPDPEKFDPERFSDENKQNIVPGTYMPFGIGPRSCIGSRFALMEIKAIIYYILLNFSMVPNAKSQIPIQLAKIPFSMKIESGLFLSLIPRKN